MKQLMTARQLKLMVLASGREVILMLFAGLLREKI